MVAAGHNLALHQPQHSGLDVNVVDRGRCHHRLDTHLQHPACVLRVGPDLDRVDRLIDGDRTTSPLDGFLVTIQRKDVDLRESVATQGQGKVAPEGIDSRDADSVLPADHGAPVLRGRRPDRCPGQLEIAVPTVVHNPQPLPCRLHVVLDVVLARRNHRERGHGSA